jgi:hypothetical protein
VRKPAKGVKKSSNKDKQQVIEPVQPILSEKAKGKRKAVDIVPEESEAEEDGEPIAIFLTQQQGSPDSYLSSTRNRSSFSGCRPRSNRRWSYFEA